ncbi:MAG: hypothetical protein AB7N76_08940 [Planctomycetota bacterium]
MLPRTQFTDWTDYGYASFYKRYLAGLQALAARRFACDPAQAEALAHGFIAEQCLVPSGGLLARFDRSRRFRSYLAAAFLNHCRRALGRPEPAELPDEPAAPEEDDPAWNLLSEEAERLRRRVREAVELGRASLLERGALSKVERAYLELKWPGDPGEPPRSDREVGDRLAARGLLESKSPAARVRAAARIGESVGAALLTRLRALLEEEYRAHLPEAELSRETSLSLSAILHVLAYEEPHEAA